MSSVISSTTGSKSSEKRTSSATLGRRRRALSGGGRLSKYVAEYWKDFEFKCGCGCGRSKIHPALLELADDVRRFVGVPLRSNSGVRCAAHNSSVGGRPASLHLNQGSLDVGHAFDCTYSSAELRTPLNIARLYILFESFGRKHGELGLGLYESFVHVDVRGRLGRRSGRWQGPKGFAWSKL